LSLANTVLGTILRLSVPFSGDAEAFAIQPSTFTSGPPHARVTQGAIVIAYSAVDLNPQRAKTELDGVIDNIESILDGSASLKTVVRTAVEARKAKVLRDCNSIAALGLNLKPRADAPKTYVAPVKRKPVGIQTSKAVAPFKPEPVLDEETYNHSRSWRACRTSWSAARLPSRPWAKRRSAREGVSRHDHPVAGVPELARH
jgi:hypothetical protein